MKKINFYLKFNIIFLIIITLINLFNNFCFGSTPKLVSTLEKAFENIESWLITLATPAAAVAVRNRNIYEKI